MRRIVVLFLTLMTCSLLFADVDDAYKSYKIYAYKNAQSSGGNLPDPSCVLRILDSHDTTLNQNSLVEIPQENRNRQYSAFSWVLGGNIYGKVELTFQFGPMLRYRVADTSAEGFQCIPYTVEVEHVESRIGNRAITTVNYGGTKYNSTYPEESNVTGTSYRIYYVDSVSGSDVTQAINLSTINSSGYKEVKLDYYMNYSTVIKDTNGNVVNNYTSPICDYWNRTGDVKVTLNVGADGTIIGTQNKYLSGLYYATVKAVVTAM